MLWKLATCVGTNLGRDRLTVARLQYVLTVACKFHRSEFLDKMSRKGGACPRSATIIVLMLPTYVPPLAGKLVPRFLFR
jgi:hypothetical protein